MAFASDNAVRLYAPSRESGKMVELARESRMVELGRARGLRGVAWGERHAPSAGAWTHAYAYARRRTRVVTWRAGCRAVERTE